MQSVRLRYFTLRIGVVVAAVTVGSTAALGCGAAVRRTGLAHPAPPLEAAIAVVRTRGSDSDHDDDRRGMHGDPDNDEVLTFGHLADRAKAAGMVAFMRSYYRAAAAGDGRAACSMLDKVAAEAVADAAPAGERTCTRAVERVFTEHRREIAEDVISLDPIEARIREGRGLLWLRLGGREVLIQMHRAGDAWRLDGALEEEGP